MSPDEEYSRRRGGPLTAALTVVTLAQIVGLIFLIVALRAAIDHGRDDERGLFLLPIIGTVLVLIALIGVWALYRWGVYLFAAVATVGLITDLIAGLPTQAIVIRIAVIALLGTAVAKRWEAFS